MRGGDPVNSTDSIGTDLFTDALDAGAKAVVKTHEYAFRFVKIGRTLAAEYAYSHNVHRRCGRACEDRYTSNSPLVDKLLNAP
jgi:hypothetical protein